MMRSMRLRTDELLGGLTAPVVVQGSTVCDALTVASSDADRRRLLLSSTTGSTLPPLALGPAELAAGSPEGLVRLPGEIVSADEHVVALVVDPLLAEFEGRRRQWRLDLALPIRGQPASGGQPWSGTTRDVSAGGARVDVDLPAGSSHRIALRVGGTELRLGAAVARTLPEGGSALGFAGLSDAATRALAVQLLREGAMTQH
jgi:hypothetical protein